MEVSVYLGTLKNFSKTEPLVITDGSKKGLGKFSSGGWLEKDLTYIPEKVIFNGTTTICYWKDGTKTVVKCSPDEPFIPEVGVAEATVRKIYGSRMAFLRIVKNAYVQPEKKDKKDKTNAL